MTEITVQEILQETAEERQERHKSMTIVALAKELKLVKAELSMADDYKTVVQKIYDSLAKVTIPERMDEEEIDIIKIDGVGRVQKKADIYCSCPANNREALQEWLIDNGHGFLVQSTVNSSTLKAFVKEQMKAGNEVPTHLLNITPYQLASIVIS